jgi:OOP family OmpA-OmpF porin
MQLRNWSRITLYALAITGASLVQAEPIERNVESVTVESTDEISLFGTYINPDHERNADHGVGFRAIYGHGFNDHLWGEAQFFSHVFEAQDDTGQDAYQEGLGGDLAYRFIPEAAVTPFALAGIGIGRNDVDAPFADSEGINAFANAGLGLLTSGVTDLGLRFRAEARYFFDAFSNDRDDVQLSLGVTLPIGVQREKVIREVRIREKIVETQTKPSVRDSDGDGVVDAKDLCPETLEGLEVNADGCVPTDTEQSVILKGVTFKFDSAELTPNAKTILVNTVESLQQQPDLAVEIGGHTDHVGPADYNRELSQRRAESVLMFLVENGIDRDRLQAKGYGESRPAFTNETEAGRTRNRRVELSIESTKE